MKNLLGFIVAIAGLNIVASCAQNRQLVDQLPFKITQQYYTSWVAQQPKNSSGMDVYITITDKPDDISLKSIFFKEQSAVLTQKKGGIYSAHFISTQEKADYTISTDRSKEVNNPKPQLPEEPPVKIRASEALLIYSQNGKTHYFKLKNMKDKGTKYPAEAPFNKND
ncbi:MAG TPA: hypothetical protein ENH91_03195 [Leeuwenhoekiella sp.]|nr:hypothetical protein [Leeuwenhoekiella sp.]